jgi:hypothetical protein
MTGFVLLYTTTTTTTILLLLGIVFGLVMYQLVYRLKSSYVLPCSLFGILILFYCSLMIAGASLQDARDFGWIAPLTQPGG